jgi:predicted PurR-regulated permease PerM
VLVTVLGLVVVLVAAGFVLVPTISGEFAALVQMVQGCAREGSPLRQRMANALPPEVYESIEAFLADEGLQRFLRENAELHAAAVAAVKWVVPQLWGVVTGAWAIIGATVQVFLVLLYLVFILIDYHRIRDTWRDYLPPKQRESIVAFLSDFSGAMSRYFRGQFIVAMSVGVLFAIGFSLVGIRMAILLGLFVGLLNMVPYLQIVGVPPALLLAVLTAFDKGGSVFWYLVGVALVFVVVQVLQDAVITPRVMGKVTGLRPVIILFSVLFWGKLLGLLGLLLAIPLTCLGLAYYQRLLARQQRETGAE